MPIQAAKLGTLTILNTAQESNIIQTTGMINLIAILFYNPATLTGVVAVEVAWDDAALAAAHAALYDGGSAVVLTAGRVERHTVNGFRSIMLDADTNQTGDRSVEVVGIFDI